MAANAYDIALPAMLVIMLVFGFIIDAYAVFLKVAVAERLGESLAMANLVQYLARVSNVLVVFVLSFAFETGRLESNIVHLFMLASAFGVIFVILLIYVKCFCNFITYCLYPVLYVPFPSISKRMVWQDLKKLNVKDLRLFAASAATNLLIVLAMFIPFGISAVYPEMRMTSVYVGQLVNFLATLLVFAIQEPVSMRLVDDEAYHSAGSALLWGRAFSYCSALSTFFLIY